MVALAFTGLASPGKGGFNAAPLNPGNFGLAKNLFLGVVFSIFAFSGWESTGPMAEESKNPKRNVPIGLVGSVIILMIYFIFVTWGYLVGIGTSKVGSIPTAAAWPVATMAQRVWGGAWVFLLFALLNSAIAVSIACFNGGTRTWYGMGRSGVLPAALAKVNPKRQTPVNAIHLEVGMQVVAFACVLIFGVSNVFITWANAITIGLVLMYILANIGVVKYYLTEGRAQFNPVLHLIVPLIASAAGGVVVWYSYFSPFTSTGPVFWGLMVFFAVLVVTIGALIYMRVRGQEGWMLKAQLVFEQSGGGH
jgi:amino acid transporter